MELQQTLSNFADTLERIRNLLNWTHPAKTGLVYAVLLVGLYVSWVIPFRWLFLSWATKKFYKGMLQKQNRLRLIMCQKQQQTISMTATLREASRQHAQKRNGQAEASYWTMITKRFTVGLAQRHKLGKHNSNVARASGGDGSGEGDRRGGRAVSLEAREQAQLHGGLPSKLASLGGITTTVIDGGVVDSVKTPITVRTDRRSHVVQDAQANVEADVGPEVISESTSLPHEELITSKDVIRLTNLINSLPSDRNLDEAYRARVGQSDNHPTHTAAYVLF